MIEAWFDGACEPVNPGGTATCGIILKKDGKTVYYGHGIVGRGPKMSNNVAEYAGLIRILELLITPSGRGFLVEKDRVVIRGDSQLVINQMRKIWRVGNKNGLYYPYFLKASDLLEEARDMGWVISFVWIPREENQECDALSKFPGSHHHQLNPGSDAAQECPGTAGEQPGGRVEPTS